MTSKERNRVGERELELLRWVADHGSCTVGQATAGFGESLGLARTTVQTMLERLHAKQRLRRRKVDGVFRYDAVESPGEVLRGAVHQFIEQTLDGSVSPFVAYLSERQDCSDEELQELRALVDQLQRSKEGAG